MNIELYQKVIALLLKQIEDLEHDLDRANSRYDLLLEEYIKLSDNCLLN